MTAEQQSSLCFAVSYHQEQYTKTAITTQMTSGFAQHLSSKNNPDRTMSITHSLRV